MVFFFTSIKENTQKLSWWMIYDSFTNYSNNEKELEMWMCFLSTEIRHFATGNYFKRLCSLFDTTVEFFDLMKN